MNTQKIIDLLPPQLQALNGGPLLASLIWLSLMVIIILLIILIRPLKNLLSPKENHNEIKKESHSKGFSNN
tara:strand:+ start:34 stop:246 length:213 start_codon:yes stop_codon:yes gene_type:complete